jgi:DNA relaxase NicK
VTRHGEKALQRWPSADGSDGATMGVDAKGSELIVIYETQETQGAA